MDSLIGDRFTVNIGRKLAAEELIYDTDDPVLLNYQIGEKEQSLCHLRSVLSHADIEKLHQVLV